MFLMADTFPSQSFRNPTLDQYHINHTIVHIILILNYSSEDDRIVSLCIWFHALLTKRPLTLACCFKTLKFHHQAPTFRIHFPGRHSCANINQHTSRNEVSEKAQCTPQLKLSTQKNNMLPLNNSFVSHPSIHIWNAHNETIKLCWKLVKVRCLCCWYWIASYTRRGDRPRDPSWPVDAALHSW